MDSPVSKVSIPEEKMHLETTGENCVCVVIRVQSLTPFYVCWPLQECNECVNHSEYAGFVKNIQELGIILESKSPMEKILVVFESLTPHRYNWLH